MKLSDVLSTVPAIVTIDVQDSTGSIYSGCCQDFRATCEDAYDLLDREVSLIRPCDYALIIGLN